MVISKNSWHYKWFSFVRYFGPGGDCNPRSLCSYLWRIALNTCCLLMGLLVLIGAVVLFLSLIYGAFQGDHDARTELAVILGCIAVCVTPALFVVGLAKFSMYLQNYQSNSIWFKGFVVQTLADTKNKVCPLIKYED